MSEKQLEKKIILTLKMLGYYVYKTTGMSGAFDYNMQYNEAGMSDLIIIGKSGVIFMEVKTQTGKQSIEQKVFEQICIKNNVKYVLVRSVKDAINAIK